MKLQNPQRLAPVKEGAPLSEGGNWNLGVLTEN